MDLYWLTSSVHDVYTCVCTNYCEVGLRKYRKNSKIYCLFKQQEQLDMSMNSLTPEQLYAVHSAQQLLVNAGINISLSIPSQLLGISKQPLEAGADSSFTIPTASASAPSLEFLVKLNCKSLVHGIINHPLGSIVEFPQSGLELNQGIAHRFTVDPQYLIHPKDNIQYSLGDSRGSRPNVNCLLFTHAFGQPVLCYVSKISCE